MWNRLANSFSCINYNFIIVVKVKHVNVLLHPNHCHYKDPAITIHQLDHCMVFITMIENSIVGYL